METQTLEPIPAEETDKLLIFQNDSEISRITNQSQGRADLLNQILKHGLLTNEEITKVTSSATAIDDHIFREQLKINKELKKQFDAGKKNLKGEYELPQNLQALKDLLLAWNSYPTGRHSDKFQHLIFIDTWRVDTAELESLFINSNLKVFVESELLAEWKNVEKLCEIFMRYEMPGQQIKESQFLNKRIEQYGRNLFRPRWTYFLK